MITIYFPSKWTWWQCMTWMDALLPDRTECTWDKFYGYWRVSW